MPYKNHIYIIIRTFSKFLVIVTLLVSTDHHFLEHLRTFLELLFCKITVTKCL